MHFRLLKMIATSSRMHQIRFQPVLPPDPAGGAYSSPPEPLACLRGPTSKGRGGKGTRKKRMGGKGRGEDVGEGRKV